MHIGFITPEYPDERKPEGGLGNYVRKTGFELTERGHRVTVFVLANNRGNKSDYGIEIINVRKIKIHWRIKQKPTLAAWLGLLEWWINILRIKHSVQLRHRHFHLDIVQTPNYKAPGFALCHNSSFPIVCRCSSYSPLLQAANGDQRKLPNVIADWIETKQVIESDATFAPSDFIAHIYERFESITPAVIRTPISPINWRMDNTAYTRMVYKKKYLLYFGTLNGIKGVDVLIQGASNILSRYKDISLVFIGRNDTLPDGTEALSRIQTVLEPYWKAKRVIYSPVLAKTQLFPIIKNAVGVVMPSRVDNYPNSCLEALQLKVPVIGTYDSSLEEIIIDGKTGFLFENGDSEAMCRAIDRLISASETERRIMRTEMESVLKQISLEDRVGQLINFFQLVLN